MQCSYVNNAPSKQNKNLFSVSMEIFLNYPYRNEEAVSMEIKNHFFQQIDWQVVNYCSENKMKIPSISYAEVQSDLQAPLKQTRYF